MNLEFPNDPDLLRRAWAGIVATSRDNSRLPVSWSAERNAGFTTADQPWMRVNDNYPEINVEKQLDDENSVLRFWRSVLSLRKEHVDVFVHGDYEVFDYDNEATFTFTKRSKGGRVALVCLNFSTERQKCSVPKELEGKKLELLARNVVSSDAEGRVGRGTEVELEAWEGRVYLVREEDEGGFVIV